MEEEKKKKKNGTHDMWHVTCDTWHVTCDTWHVIRDTWHMTNGVGGTFSQNFSSLALTVCDFWYYEDMEEKADWINELINDEAVYRTRSVKNTTSIYQVLKMFYNFRLYLNFGFPLELNTERNMGIKKIRCVIFLNLSDKQLF